MRFEVDGWLDGEWRSLTEGTTVGYKRICRFQAVTTNRIRIRILDARVCPTLSHVGIHYAPKR